MAKGNHALHKQVTITVRDLHSRTCFEESFIHSHNFHQLHDKPGGKNPEGTRDKSWEKKHLNREKSTEGIRDKVEGKKI